MKNTALIFFLLFIFSVLNRVYASEVTVDISNNSQVINDVNVNSTSQGSDSTSDVTIETNGDKKSFHAEGNQEINWQSDDGSSQVHIKTGKAENNVNINQNVGSNETIAIIESSDLTTNETVSRKFQEFSDITGDADSGFILDFIKESLETLNELTLNIFHKLIG